MQRRTHGRFLVLVLLTAAAPPAAPQAPIRLAPAFAGIYSGSEIADIAEFVVAVLASD